MNEAKYAKFQALVARLQAIREKWGEDTFNEAARDAYAQLTKEGGDAAEFAKEAFKDIPGIEDTPVSAEPVQGSSNPLIEMIRQAMPGIKTQAQFDAFMSAFDGLRMALNGIFVGNLKEEADGKDLMERAFTAAHQVTELTNKLKEVPEAATSKVAEKFKQPPVEFIEEPLQRLLLAELAALDDRAALAAWYNASRARIDRVVTPKLRNDLFDAIRHKRNVLEKGDGG